MTDTGGKGFEERIDAHVQHSADRLEEHEAKSAERLQGLQAKTSEAIGRTGTFAKEHLPEVTAATVDKAVESAQSFVTGERGTR